MIRSMITIALAGLAAASVTAQEPQATLEVRKVLVVLAHPDDELFMAPAIAALARLEKEVTLAYATAGEAGPGVSALDKGDALAAVRRQEADCAGKALGASNVVIFNRGDGRLGLDAHHPNSAAKTLLADLQGIVPDHQLVLTWGPDGGYGHGDHRMVSALTTQVVQAMAPIERPMLLYVGIPAGQRPAVPEMQDWATTDPMLLNIPGPYLAEDLAAARAAAMCHATQFDETTRRGMMDLFDATMWRGNVHFRMAFAAGL
jgi:LmbE family N-acetylglucosaminyl deacetylase